MAFGAVITTIRCSNLADASVYADVALEGLIDELYETQDEAGEREPGAGAVMLQNLATRGHVDLVLHRFRVDAGEWDYGDYQKCIRYFRAKHLWLQSVTGTSASVQSGTDTAGTDAPLWTNTAGLPRKVVVKFDKPEYIRRSGAPALMNWSVQLIDEKPTIGVTIT